MATQRRIGPSRATTPSSPGFFKAIALAVIASWLILSVKADTVAVEINPVSDKFSTKKDPDMPGYPDFHVLAKDKLHVWNDTTLSLTATKPLPGIYQARVGVANGYDDFLLLSNSLSLLYCPSLSYCPLLSANCYSVWQAWFFNNNKL